MEAIREGLQATTSGQRRKHDWDLGLHYTSAADTNGRPLGSIAVVLSPIGRKRNLWRFGDRSDRPIALSKGRLFRRIGR